MSSYLCISIRFAGPMFRGRGDGGEPEWPPSPLRVFQALVAASAARFGNPDRFRDYAAPAFAWLGGLRAPNVIAPAGETGTPFRMAVPNNDMDVIGRAWARNAEPDRQPAQLKTLKTVRPTHMRDGEEFPAVHYVWEITDVNKAGCEKHKESLFAAARSVVALGWGVDMAVGHGRMLDGAGLRELEQKGERWNPTAEGRSRLRVPVAGTFDDLVRRHHDFVNRLPPTGGFVPVPPLTVFEVVGYRRDTDVAERPVVAFELRTPEFDRFQPYDPVRRTPAVAGMVRNAVAELARQTRPFGWTDENINTFVHGHTPSGTDRARGAGADNRFSYLPLPSLERRGSSGTHVGAIRRVLIVAPAEHRAAVTWARVLSGQALTPERDTRAAALRIIDRPTANLRTDRNLSPYLGASRVWSTVTPVVLHRHEPTAVEVRGLLETAFRHAGFSDAVVSGLELEWRNVGFRAGVDLAARYETPEKLTGPRYHVRVRFAHPVRGPLAVGAGRYRGLGLFAAEE